MLLFLQKNNLDTDYTGIDIVPEFITKAQDRFKNTEKVTFEHKDITSLPDIPQFDYILASGALSFKVADNKNYYFGIIKKMFTLAKYGVAFNMLNETIHVDDETYAAYDANEVADFCKTFCDRVEIIVGYLPQDF